MTTFVIDKAYAAETKSRSIIDGVTGCICRLVRSDAKTDDHLVEIGSHGNAQYWIAGERLISMARAMA